MNFDLKKDSKRIVVICIAAVIMAVNIQSFVRTAGLYPGGVTGLTILIQRAAEQFLGIALPYTLINLLLNAVPVYIGFRFIGKKFTVYSCLMIVLTSVLTDLLPSHIITYNTLLISIFGGIINGLVMSLCLMMDATTGGTDFISIYFSKKTGMDSWNLILCINIVIIGAAGLLFGWEKAFYSIIFQYSSTQVLHVMYKRYQKQTIFIVTNRAKEICDGIYSVSHHGATILDGQGSYEHEKRDVVYSVVSGEESKKVLAVVKEIDPHAFINVLKTEELSGSFYQRPTD
jgi:uncharacterized membrane-anchored protein YitT (DUF2179 family)